MARALEQLKPEGARVVDDPYAHLFLSRPSRAALAAWTGSLTGRALRRLGRTGTTYVPLRHRFIDGHLLAALDAGAEQVVLLGAGYDTRAYRFTDRLAGRPVYEVDLAAISAAKAAVVAKHVDELPDANVVRVGIDFETDPLGATLEAAGFSVGSRTFFTWEGVPMYLTRDAVKATLAAVWELSGPGSLIAHDMWHMVDDPGARGTVSRLAPNALSFIGEPVTFGIHPEEVGFFLSRQGFRVVDLASAAELQERYAPGERVLSDASLYVLAAERVEST